MKTKLKMKKFDKLINKLSKQYYIISLPVHSVLDWRTGVSLIRKKDLREINAYIYDEGCGISVEIGAGIEVHYFNSYRKAIEFIKTL